MGGGSAASEADAVGAGDEDAVGAAVGNTAAVGAWLADDEAVAGGLELSDGPAVHAMTRSPMAAISRPKARLMPDRLAARLGEALGGRAARNKCIGSLKIRFLTPRPISMTNGLADRQISS